MKPDRYEWLHAEQERCARDPHGLVALRTRAARNFGWHLGILLAIVPPVFVMAALTQGRGEPSEAIGLSILGFLEMVAAIAIWRLIERKSIMVKAAGWTALVFGLFALLLGVTGLASL